MAANKGCNRSIGDGQSEDSLLLLDKEYEEINKLLEQGPPKVVLLDKNKQRQLNYRRSLVVRALEMNAQLHKLTKQSKITSSTPMPSKLKINASTGSSFALSPIINDQVQQNCAVDNHCSQQTVNSTTSNCSITDIVDNLWKNKERAVHSNNKTNTQNPSLKVYPSSNVKISASENIVAKKFQKIARKLSNQIKSSQSRELAIATDILKTLDKLIVIPKQCSYISQYNKPWRIHNYLSTLNDPRDSLQRNSSINENLCKKLRTNTNGNQKKSFVNIRKTLETNHRTKKVAEQFGWSSDETSETIPEVEGDDHVDSENYDVASKKLSNAVQHNDNNKQSQITNNSKSKTRLQKTLLNGDHSKGPQQNFHVEQTNDRSTHLKNSIRAHRSTVLRNASGSSHISLLQKENVDDKPQKSSQLIVTKKVTEENDQSSESELHIQQNDGDDYCNDFVARKEAYLSYCNSGRAGNCNTRKKNKETSNKNAFINESISPHTTNLKNNDLQEQVQEGTTNNISTDYIEEERSDNMSPVLGNTQNLNHGISRCTSKNSSVRNLSKRNRNAVLDIAKDFTNTSDENKGNKFGKTSVTDIMMPEKGPVQCEENLCKTPVINKNNNLLEVIEINSSDSGSSEVSYHSHKRETSVSERSKTTGSKISSNSKNFQKNIQSSSSYDELMISNKKPSSRKPSANNTTIIRSRILKENFHNVQSLSRNMVDDENQSNAADEALLIPNKVMSPKQPSANTTKIINRTFKRNKKCNISPGEDRSQSTNDNAQSLGRGKTFIENLETLQSFTGNQINDKNTSNSCNNELICSKEQQSFRRQSANITKIIYKNLQENLETLEALDRNQIEEQAQFNSPVTELTISKKQQSSRQRPESSTKNINSTFKENLESQKTDQSPVNDVRNGHTHIPTVTSPRKQNNGNATEVINKTLDNLHAKNIYVRINRLNQSDLGHSNGARQQCYPFTKNSTLNCPENSSIQNRKLSFTLALGLENEDAQELQIQNSDENTSGAMDHLQDIPENTPIVSNDVTDKQPVSSKRFLHQKTSTINPGDDAKNQSVGLNLQQDQKQNENENPIIAKRGKRTRSTTRLLSSSSSNGSRNTTINQKKQSETQKSRQEVHVQTSFQNTILEQLAKAVVDEAPITPFAEQIIETRRELFTEIESVKNKSNYEKVQAETQTDFSKSNPGDNIINSTPHQEQNIAMNNNLVSAIKDTVSRGIQHNSQARNLFGAQETPFSPAACSTKNQQQIESTVGRTETIKNKRKYTSRKKKPLKRLQVSAEIEESSMEVRRSTRERRPPRERYGHNSQLVICHTEKDVKAISGESVDVCRTRGLKRLETIMECPEEKETKPSRRPPSKKNNKKVNKPAILEKISEQQSSPLPNGNVEPNDNPNEEVELENWTQQHIPTSSPITSTQTTERRNMENEQQVTSKSKRGKQIEGAASPDQRLTEPENIMTTVRATEENNLNLNDRPTDISGVMYIEPITSTQTRPITRSIAKSAKSTRKRKSVGNSETVVRNLSNVMLKAATSINSTSTSGEILCDTLQPQYKSIDCGPVKLEVADSIYSKTKKMSSHFLKIKGGKSKPRQLVNNHTMFFNVLSGEAEICLNSETFRVKRFNTFQVPAGYEYSITNRFKTKELLLFFVKSEFL